MGYVEEHQILHPEQRGSGGGWSCESQLLGFVDEVLEALGKGCQEDVLIMDFSKVSHSLLIHKLQQYALYIYGISERVNQWIENLLSNCQQKAGSH